MAKSWNESLLILSDVHLGSDLNDHPVPVGRRSRRIDEDFVQLIVHYRKATPPAGQRWRLVIAGDFIDFIGMAIKVVDEPLATELSEEERAHGLGNAEDHAKIKLRMCARRHADVFGALADFVAEGHAVTLVHGNHDVEFYWESVQREFREILFMSISEKREGMTPESFTRRVEFNPWFFYADGIAYIEHGHQYDEFCSTEHVMAPLCPTDPRRIARGVCEVLLRFVVRPTRGMKEHGHENTGLLHYIHFAVRLGMGGLWALGVRFGKAVLELFRLRRGLLSATARTLREEHERRMSQFAEATRVGLDRLRALAALQARPISNSISGIMASVLLDRLVLAVLSILLLVLLAVVGAYYKPALIAAVIVVGGWLAGHVYLSRKRQPDPQLLLMERAGRLAHLFPAAFVVMGHTHTPAKVPVAQGAATYINVGSWAEEEADDGHENAYRAARTHLVIHCADDKPVAEFLKWGPEGPRAFRS